MEDFFVQECCGHGTDLENFGPTSILCDDPLPIESNVQCADCTGCTGTGEEDVQDASSAIIATCFPVWTSPHLLPLLGPGCRRIESAETDNCSPQLLPVTTLAGCSVL